MKKLNELINTYLGKDTLLYFVLIKTYYRWKPKYIDIDQVIGKFSETNKNIVFIQVGSNDGKTQDPVYKYVTNYAWRGILIEPVRYLFEKLKENYNGFEDQLFFENAAVSKIPGKKTFYYLKQTDDPSVPFWAIGLGSFDKNVILKHKMYIPQIEDLIVEEDVPAVTLSDLQQKYNVPKPDVLMIDTEGYDFEILKSYHFSEHKPSLIVYEHRHLSNQEYKESMAYLRSSGYSLFALECDTLAVHESLLQKQPDLLRDVNDSFPRERVIKMLRFNNSY